MMVKLTGPGLGKEASGSIGGELVFSNWKRTPYLKKLTKPKQPRTWGQQAMRAMMSFLSEQWTNVSAANRLTWQPLADQTNVSAFNAYQSYNLQRWRNLVAPTWVYPPGTAGGWGNITWPVLTALQRGIEFRWSVITPDNLWAIAITQLPTSGAPLAWDGLRKMDAALTPGLKFWLWSPLPPGTYYFRWIKVLVHGRMGYGALGNVTIPP